MFKKLGPGILVTAAFIGPGTITTASKAGAGYGAALLWAVLFAVVATIILQEMAARLGLVSRQGLGESIRGTFSSRWSRAAAASIIVLAIGFGNAAYQTGNIMGAALGLEAALGFPLRLWAGAVTLTALVLLATGTYRTVERVLIGLVLVMSGLFLVTVFLAGPRLDAIVHGALWPSIPPGSLTTVIGLIGTTVVPYNLFLHASSVREKWSDTEPVETSLREARWDTVLSILLGGLVTGAIVATAGAALFPGGSIKNPGDMARQLEPLLGGPAARICFAAGLFAAGLTSAITAPLAAAYAIRGALGWHPSTHPWQFRMVWLAVLLTGAILAITLEKSPTETILIAQVANGLLLPLVAVFLLVAVNQSKLMGAYRNGPVANLLGVGVVLVVAALGAWKVLRELKLI